MKFVFNRAKTSQARARVTLIGPSGTGKTYTALKMAQGLGERIAVIDTENGSASKYADEFEFHVLKLEEFSPQNYVKAIHAAEEAGFDVLIIDSLSHAWIGRGGALEMVNKAERRYHGNSFAAWRDVTPHHNAMIDAIVRCSCHLIATMRCKTDYIIETDSKGKKMPRKVGLAPIQREGVEYEFDIVADMDLEHNMLITKTRCRALDGAVFHKPGLEVAEIIRKWLSDPSELQVDEVVSMTVRPAIADVSTAEAPRLETKPSRQKLNTPIKIEPQLEGKSAQVEWRDAAMTLKKTAQKYFNGDHEIVLAALKRKEGVESSRAIPTERLLALTEEIEQLSTEGEPSMRAQLLIWKQMVAQPEDPRASLLI